MDRTTTPAFVEEASRIVLSGRGLGTAPDSRGQVAMNGRLTGGAPFEIKGTLGAIGGPLNLELDGKLTDFPLTRVNPYSNKLIGWVARRGAFGATVHYRVVDNRIEATNDLLIGQPEYAPSRSGDEVRDRVGVPFGMLVSLLKNVRGEIKLSVPVSGDLASRQFDLSDAFWAAMRETAISVMALPVSWVGKIFYTEDARIETVRIWPVNFEAGTTRIARDFEQQAERLAGFLRDAPGLTLAMKPVHTVEDIVALKREAVRQRIDAGAREPGQTAEAVAARLFAERFPGQAPPPRARRARDRAGEGRAEPGGGGPQSRGPAHGNHPRPPPGRQGHRQRRAPARHRGRGPGRGLRPGPHRIRDRPLAGVTRRGQVLHSDNVECKT